LHAPDWLVTLAGMKPRRVSVVLLATVSLCAFCTRAPAQQTVAQSLAIIDEKLNRLRADVDALQFNQEKLQRQIDDLQSQLLALRQTSAGISANDIQALQARIQAVDAARENDKKIILDQLAKELAGLSASRASAASASPATGTVGTEHVVKPGETLASIAKGYGVSVADMVKANNIANPNEIKVGQRLTVPK
jgi:LysM repeat protein